MDSTESDKVCLAFDHRDIVLIIGPAKDFGKPVTGHAIGFTAYGGASADSSA